MAVLEEASVRERLLPISVEQYHRLCELDLVQEATELIDGFIFRKMTKSPLHSFVLARLLEQVRANARAGYWVRQELPLTLAASEPEPDVSVVRGAPGDFRNAHPGTAVWVAEVAVSSLTFDQQKTRVYAAAGIPECWIVLPRERRIDVYKDASDAGYADVREFGAGEDVPFPFGGSCRPGDLID